MLNQLSIEPSEQGMPTYIINKSVAERVSYKGFGETSQNQSQKNAKELANRRVDIVVKSIKNDSSELT